MTLGDMSDTKETQPSGINPNQAKINQLTSMAAQVRIGGKGCPRRKKKVVHRTATTDDKKLQSTLKKLAVTNIPGIEEVNMFKSNGEVIHFNNPKVQASLSSNTFSITGQAETKPVTELLPGIFNQLGAESLKKLASNISSQMAAGDKQPSGGNAGDDDEEVPELVGNFDEPSQGEAH